MRTLAYLKEEPYTGPAPQSVSLGPNSHPISSFPSIAPSNCITCFSVNLPKLAYPLYLSVSVEMLCSISDGKSDSNWLDRLRSSKGFPVGNGTDLEHFLNPNHQLLIPLKMELPDADRQKICPILNSDSTPSNQKPVVHWKETMKSCDFQKNKEEESFLGIMNSVLAELFNMGDSSDSQRFRGSAEKRSSRKQSNPKICVLSTSASVDDSLDGARRVEIVPAMSPSSADNSATEVKETCELLKLKKQNNFASPTVEEDKLQTDLSGYSRTEVTIIDTSSPLWKFEKLLFRKGSVWKVRDKKCKSRNVSVRRKKRKSFQSGKEVGGRKKRKPPVPPSNTIKEEDSLKCVISSTDGHLQNDRRESCKETQDFLSRVPKRRPKFSRSPRKPFKRDNSISSMKSMTTTRKNGTHLPKNCLKDTLHLSKA